MRLRKIHFLLKSIFLILLTLSQITCSNKSDDKISFPSFYYTDMTTLNLEVKSVSNVDGVSNQGNTVSEATQIVIIKLG